MKALLILLILPVSLFAQEDAPSTMHVKRPADKKDGISFAERCDKTDTVFKEIFVSASGSYTFYWGDVSSPTSASFIGDTDMVSIVRSTLTPEFISTVEHCADSISNFRTACGYTLVTVLNGSIKSYDALPINEINRLICSYDKLRQLAKVLQVLYARHHFPR